jgi:hypothetical protein
MPQISEQYHCTVNPKDTLVTYVTDIERPPLLEFALVMTNAQDQKISVMLNKEDAKRLHDQLDTFLIKCAIKRV